MNALNKLRRILAYISWRDYAFVKSWLFVQSMTRIVQKRSVSMALTAKTPAVTASHCCSTNTTSGSTYSWTCLWWPRHCLLCVISDTVLRCVRYRRYVLSQTAAERSVVCCSGVAADRHLICRAACVTQLVASSLYQYATSDCLMTTSYCYTVVTT